MKCKEFIAPITILSVAIIITTVLTTIPEDVIKTEVVPAILDTILWLLGVSFIAFLSYAGYWLCRGVYEHAQDCLKCDKKSAT